MKPKRPVLTESEARGKQSHSSGRLYCCHILSLLGLNNFLALQIGLFENFRTPLFMSGRVEACKEANDDAVGQAPETPLFQYVAGNGVRTELAMAGGEFKPLLKAAVAPSLCGRFKIWMSLFQVFLKIVP